MTDRVYPNSATTGAPTIAPAAASAAASKNPAAFPATKSQLYGATRPSYRPQPHHRRHRNRRSCCCSFCLYLTLLLIFLILLAAIFSAVFYLLYRPHRPSFSVTSLKLSYFNLTSSSLLNSKFDLNVTARNPNKKLVFAYNPISISVFSDGINIGNGLLPAFVHGKKNTTLLKVSVISKGLEIESDSVSKLKSNMKSKNGMPLEIKMDSKVKLKMGGLKTPKIGVRVSCDGITVSIPTGKKAASASTAKAKCKVDVRIKIWKWTV